ncbi:TRAP transporter substrate-binding protein DctP [Telmatospirillum sp. J64-1]|uniref:TRAP transporter substrate-binding protein DctP n=1 Tax=Telmatospirillum sp. J64-1 TaxID=2502183 RepID=UPI001C8F41AF|nr:TRAP transporter substrate-binding protein DctP [Telmatospirillum sp. J64-1]
MFRCLRYAVGGAAFVAALSVSAVSGAAERWSFYTHQSAPQFTTSVGARMLADKITEETENEVRVRLHLAGTLQISTSDITSAVAQNVVQMGDDLFFTGNVPIGALLKLPFLIQTEEEFRKASEVLQPYVEKAYADRGIVLLAGYAYPMQYVWARKEIPSISAISGMRLRVASPEQGEFVRRFGGSSVSIGASEVPSALDRGVVDGILTGSVGAELWQDMLTHGYLLGLNYNNVYIIANASAFNRLSPENQEKVRAAAQEVAQWNMEKMLNEDREIIEKLDAGRMTITTPSDEELEKAVRRMKPYWDEWARSHGEEAVKALAEVRQAVGR